MTLPRLGVFGFLDSLPARETVEIAQAIEDLGYGALWIVEALGRDAYALSGHLLAATKTLVVAPGVASIWTRTPAQAMAAARTHAEASGGRFVLGLGVNNAMAGAMRGFTYEKPVDAMRDTLAQMRQAPYAAPTADAPPIVLAALQPRMMALAAEETDGILTYFVPPEHTRHARARLGRKQLCVEQAVVLEPDPHTARAIARAYMQFYVQSIPVYTAILRRLGFDDADFAGAMSDRLVDAIVAWGSVEQLQERIDAQFAAGADHVCLLPLSTAGGNAPDLATLRALAPR